MGPRKALAEFNAVPRTTTWPAVLTDHLGNPRELIYDIEVRMAVGKVGKGTGREVHMLRLEIITKEHRPKPGTLRAGQTFSSHASCGTRSNGQHTARAVAGWDTDKVTCERCLERFGWEEERAPREPHPALALGADGTMRLCASIDLLAHALDHDAEGRALDRFFGIGGAR